MSFPGTSGPQRIVRGSVETRRRQRRALRPHVLALEERTLLSTFTVNKTADDGSTGTLRWAIGQANSNPGDNTIDFDSTAFSSPETITLNGGQLELSHTGGTEALIGPAAGVTIHGNNASRVFLVDANVTASFSGLTITGGNALIGAGLANYGSVTLTACTISGNIASDKGGGVYNHGTTTLTNCTVSGNASLIQAMVGSPNVTPSGNDTGYTVSDSDLLQTNLSRSSLTGNFRVDGEGDNYAALTNGQFGPVTTVYSPSPEVVVLHDGVQITYNLDTTTHPLGYDLTNINTYAGHVDSGLSRQNYIVEYSTVVAPNSFQVLDTVSVPEFDGAPSDTAAFLTSSTGILAGNVAAIRFSFPSNQNGRTFYRELDVLGAPTTSVGTTRGGGLYNASGNASLTNCTFSGNFAGTAGGGICIAGGSATMTNTIVAGNNSDVAGTVSGSHNLIGTGGSGGLSNGTNGNIVGVANPGLAPLGNHFGPTQTVVLLPGSPAIGAGIASGITTDQRGLPLDSPIDIGAFQVQTSPLVVNTTFDGPTSPDGQLDLRDAIHLADLLGNNQTITFDPTVFATPQTITLNGTPLEFRGTTGTEKIIGPAAGLTIHGNNASRVFQVDANVIASFSGLTITGGSTTGDNANHGGGLANYGGTATLTNCIVTGNSATGHGGGVYGSGGSTTLTDCTVTSNSANTNGGGLFISNGGSTTLTNCTVTGNTSNSDSGGGLSIDNGGNATLTNCTVTGNTCSDYAGGGGLSIDNGGNATLTNCTVTGNGGGGLFINSDHSGTATLLNTLVALQGSGPNIKGTASGSHNLIGASTPGNYGSGGLFNGVDGNLVEVANPGLAPLGDYGGKTQTFALLPGSPAIDGGISGPGVPTTDMRGVSRVGAVDIGAFESEGFTVTPVSFTPQSADIGTAFANPLTVSVVAKNPLEPVDGGVIYFGGKPFPGPTAMPAAPSAVIVNGQAGGVSVAPNNALGSYNFVVSAGGLFTTSFALTNTGTPLTALVVNTATNDSLFPGAGVLSLREAVAYASYDSLGISNITFDPTVFATIQTITLTGTELVLLNTTETVTITSPAAGLRISGGGLSRVFRIGPGAMASFVGLTISGGSTDGIGGGLFNDDGHLTLTDCTIRGNTAGDKGGGLYSGGPGDALGTTTLINCTVSGNSAGNGGGGLYDSGGTTTLNNCTVSGNTGEGLFGNFGTTILNDSTISDNTGDGLKIEGRGTALLGDSTISGNQGSGLVDLGNATFINCTISGNAVYGVYVENFYSPGKLALTNCTISANHFRYSGGLYNRFGTVTAINTIIAGNLTNGDVGNPPFAGPVLAPGSKNNLIGGISFGEIGGDYIGGNPLLAPLGDYGGPTQTMPLLPGSPAIRGGTSGAGIPTTDQRGLARVGDIDIGASQSLGFVITPVAGSTPQSADIGTQFANPLAVTVVPTNPLDPVDGGVITFGGNPVSGPTAVAYSFTATVVQGQAGIIVLPNNYLGSYNLVATAGGSSTATFALTNTGTPITALVVNTTVDSLSPGVGQLSLREAILFANANLSAGLPISFDPTVFATSRTITLALGQLKLTNTTTVESITGPAAGLTISGGGLSRVFLIDSGVTASISGLTITNGAAANEFGGGLLNQGNTSLTNCTFSGNSAGTGGGVGSTGVAATLTNCTFSGNSGGNAGGVGKFYGALTMTDCTLSGNTGRNTGGGIYILDYQFGIDDVDITTLTRCTISGNTAGRFNGGGVYAVRAAREFLTDCTITGNTAAGKGGGVFDNSRMTLTNCTISGNTAAAGGGFFNSRLATLTNCIITGNTAGAGTGGGLYSRTAFTTLGNSIVAGNTAGLAPDVYRGIQSRGKNLIGAIDGSVGWLSSDLTGSISHPVVYWVGAASNGDWDTASNWLGNAVPGQNPRIVPKVVIPNGVTVQHAANTTEIIDSLNLGSGATLEIGAGDFTFHRVSGAGTITAIVTLITSGTGSVLVEGGSLSGSGLIRADVTSSALVDPTGSLVISGNYTQTEAGILAISLAGTIGGTDYGQLFVNGTATLGGRLDVSLATGFSSGAGDAFVPLSFGSIVGDFDSKDLPGGRVFLYNANTLIILPPPRTTTTSGGDASNGTRQTTAAVPQATLTVPSNASILNLSSLPVDATVTIDGNADSTNVTGPTQNFTAIIPQSARYANLVVNGGAASNTNIINGFLGALTLNPAGTDNTLVALNTQPVSVPTTTGGKVTSTSFVVNLNTPNEIQTPERLPVNNDIRSLVDPSLLVSGALATLVLGGRFEKAVVGNGVTLYAAPAVATGGTIIPGSRVLLVGTGNKVFGAAGAVVQAYSGGNSVVQSSDSAITTVVNAYAATTGPQAQNYLSGIPVAQQAFLQGNAAAFAQFLAGDATSLAAFLRGNPTAIAQYLARNSAAQQAFLSGNSAAVAQYLATNSAAESAYIAGNSAAVTAYIAGDPAAQQAFLRQNRPGVAAYITGNSTALSAYLTADSGGISAYIASNSAALAAFLQLNPSAPNGGAALQAYLRQNPTTLSAFLRGNPTTLQTYLTGSSTALQAYLTANPDALTAYLQANTTAVSQYIASNSAARQAFLQQSSAGVAAYLVGNHASRQTFLAADPAGVSAYLVSTSSQATIDAFLATNPAAQAAYLRGGPVGLQAFLIGDGNALGAFVDTAPDSLSAYLASSPAGLQSYLLSNPAALQSYVAQNAAAIGAYLVGDPANELAYLAADAVGVSSYIVSNPTAVSAFLRANPGGAQAYLVGGTAGLLAFLQVSPTALQQYIAGNPTVLQQYLASAPIGLQQYLAVSPTGLSGYLASSPTALQQYLRTNPAALQTYLATDVAALQTYVRSNPSALQQYLSANESVVEQYVAANPTALQTYLSGNSTALQTYLSANPTVLQQYLSGSPDVLQQYLSRSPSALQGYLQQNNAAVVQYLSSNASAQSAFLRKNTASVAAYIAGNPTEIAAFLAADPAGISAYIASNPAAASAFLAGNPAARAAYGGGDAAGQAALQSYLRTNPALLSGFLQSNPATLQTYLTAGPAILQSYFSSNPAGLAAYLAQVPAVVAQYIANNSTALQAFLRSNPGGIAGFLASSPAARQAFLRGNAAGVAAYIAVNSTALSAYLTADAGGISAYIASNSPALGAFLQANPTAPNGGAALQAYLRQNPTTLSAFLTGNPSVLGAYLASSPTALAQYLHGNASALQGYLSQNASAIAQYITGNPVGQQAYLSADAAGFSAYLTGDGTLLAGYLASSAFTGDPRAVAAHDSGTLQAYLATDPVGLQSYVASNPTTLQQYITGNPTRLQGYLTGNAGILAAYLAGSPTSQQAYLAANAVGISAYLTANNSLLSAFLGWDTTSGNSQANAAYQSSGSVGLQAYLTANPGDLQAYIAAQGASNNLLQQYLSSSTTGLTQYLASASTALSQYIGANPAALSSFLTGNPAILLQYIVANPATLQQYLTGNSAALQTYLSANPTVLQEFLASNGTLLQQYLAGNPAALSQYLTSNAPALQTYLEENPTALLPYLQSAPTALAQYLTANPSSLQQFLLNNPAALGQFLASDPALLQQFLEMNPALLEQFLTAEGTTGAAHVLTGSLLSVFRLNVTLPGSGNEATGGPLSTFSIGTESLFIESLNSSQLAMVSQGLASGLAASAFQVNVTAQGSKNTLVGGILANFTVTGPGGDNTFVIEDSSLLGLLAGATIPSALTGTFRGNGSDDTFYFVGGASGNPFGNVVLIEPTGASGDTLDFSSFLGGGVNLNLDNTGPQVVSTAANLNLTLPAGGAVTNVIGTPEGDNIIGGPGSSRIQHGTPDNPNINALPAVPPATVNVQYVALNFTKFAPTVVSSSEHFHNGSGYYSAAEQQAVLAGIQTIYSRFSSFIRYTLDPAEIAQLQSMSPAALAQISLTPDDVTTLAGLVDPTFQSAVYDGGSGTYETIYFNDTPVFNTGLNANGGSGSAQAAISGGAVTGFTSVSGGFSYASPPTVTLISGAGASATATVAGGAISGITVTSVGSGYRSAPTVSISGGGGTGAKATAVVSGGQVTSITITDPGTGYTSAPTISLMSGSGATAVASLGVSGTVIINGGSGYTSAPTVTISGGGGTGATATATIRNGKVTSITITKSGSGYTSPPTITLTGGGYTSVAAVTALCSVVSLVVTSPGSGYTSPPTVVFGIPSAGGFSNEIDFGNLNQKTTMLFDVNGFLGNATGMVADSSADSFNGQSNFVNLSITIAAHELGHTLGLEHAGAFGPIGFGIANPPGASGYYPGYAGKIAAFATKGDVIASPASVGSSLANAAAGLAQLGARDAITLAFITGGTTVASNSTDPSNPAWTGMISPTVAADPSVTGPVALAGVGTVSAQPVNLYTLDVPNPITTGFDATKTFDVSAVNIVGYLGGSAAVLDGGGNRITNPATGLPYTVTTPNFYTFSGVAGQLMSFQVMSASITSIKNPVDTTLTIFGPNGELIAYNDDQFEPSDSSIHDLLLPSTGTYTVQVDSFHTTDPAFNDPNSQSYNPAAYYHAQHGAYELFMYTFSAFNAAQPPSVTNGTTATLLLPPASSGTTATVYLNSNSVATVPPGTSWYTVRNLSDGSNTITVKDDNGNSLSAYNVIVDTLPPTVAIQTGPTATTSATTASFTFNGSDAVTPSSQLIYLASLDGARFHTVTNPATFANLSVGTHTLAVEAEDQAGNVSPPVSFTWTVEPTIGTTTTVTSTALNNTSVYGQAVTLSATVDQLTLSPNSPAGEVVFYNGTTRIGGAGLTNGQHQVSIPVVLPAGSYTITATYAGDGTDLTSTSSTYTLTVAAAPLTIRVENLTRVYGQPNPSFITSYQGFVLGQNADVLSGSLKFATAASTGSAVGTYIVALNGLTSTDYAVQFVNGLLSVTPAPLTVTASNAVKLYGLAVPTLSAAYSGFVNGDTVASLARTAKLTTPATPLSPAGTYPIVPSGASAGNYTIQYVPGILTVEPNAGRSAFVSALYRLTLGRLPEPAGLTYWLTQLSKGESQAAVAQRIYDSREAQLARTRHKVAQLRRSTVYTLALKAEAKAYTPAGTN